MSMTLHRHGNGVRLGIMGDALIGPQHFMVARTFPKSVRNLADVLGVPRAPSRSPSPNPLNPTTSPGYWVTGSSDHSDIYRKKGRKKIGTYFPCLILYAVHHIFFSYEICNRLTSQRDDQNRDTVISYLYEKERWLRNRMLENGD